MSSGSDARLVVIGGGTMGRGIALAAVGAGLDTTLVDTDHGVLAVAETYVTERAARQAGDGQPGRISIATDLVQAVAGCTIVIEAAVERADVKQALFSVLGEHAPHGALLASNTSTLRVADMAAAAGGSQRVIGMHFFNPAHRMALVEVVVAPTTSDATLDDTLELCRRLGKQPVVVADVPGFVTSRLGLLLGNEAMRIVEEGTASAADVDTAMRLGYNHPLGPLELADLVGLDARLNNLRSVSERMQRPEFAPPQLLVNLVAAGKLGRKSGEGFYRYDADGKPIDGARHG